MEPMTDLLDAAPPAPEAKRKKKTTRNVLFFFLGIVVIGALVATVFVAKLANDFDGQKQTIAKVFPKEEARPAVTATGAKNILLLGSDSRGDGVDMAEAGAASDQRSDTMMWVHIPADHKNITMMSIMRDTWVSIPGIGEAKINAAMAHGGVPLVVETLEGLFNNRIDHVAIVDFEGFKAITDALGGVTVPVTVPFNSNGFTFNAGPQLMSGDQALAFVRERYSFTDGDYQRVRNQQIFLKSIMGTVLTPQTLANPAKVSELVNQVSPYISVDSGLDASTLGALAVSLRDIRAANVLSFTLPTSGTGTSADGQSIVLKDDAAIAAISDALSNDSLVSYLTANGLG